MRQLADTTLLLLIGAVVGWYARIVWARIQDRRFVERSCAAAVERRRRTRVAQRERFTTWPIAASSDAAAWDVFHQRARIGEVRA